MTGRLLIAHGEASRRILLAARATAGSGSGSGPRAAQVALAATLPELETKLAARCPDIVLLDAALPGLTATGLQRLATAPGAPPVLVLLPAAGGLSRLEALTAGAADVLDAPYQTDLLLALLRKIIRDRDSDREVQQRRETCRALGFADPAAPFAAPARIRVVAQPGPAAERLAAALARATPHRIDLQHPAHALDAPPPDVLVMTDPSETRARLPDIRSWDETRHVGVLVCFAPHAASEAAAALDLGADDAMTAGAEPAEIALRLDRLVARKRAAARLRDIQSQGLEAALTDPLTGLYNRRYAFVHTARLAEEAQASGRAWALIVGDLDHFKRINDRHGHAAGDAVLRTVAQRLRGCLRAQDLVARIGGEEFLIALPDTDRGGAIDAAERIRSAIARGPVTVPGRAGPISVTMSLGVAVARPAAEAPQDQVIRVMERADRALYGSKERGRNTVTVGRRRRSAA